MSDRRLCLLLTRSKYDVERSLIFRQTDFCLGGFLLTSFYGAGFSTRKKYSKFFSPIKFVPNGFIVIEVLLLKSFRGTFLSQQKVQTALLKISF